MSRPLRSVHDWREELRRNGVTLVDHLNMEPGVTRLFVRGTSGAVERACQVVEAERLMGQVIVVEEWGA